MGRSDDLYLSLRGKSANRSMHDECAWGRQTLLLSFQSCWMAKVHLGFRFATLISWCATRDDVLSTVITRRITRFIFTRIFNAATRSAGWRIHLLSVPKIKCILMRWMCVLITPFPYEIKKTFLGNICSLHSLFTIPWFSLPTELSMLALPGERVACARVSSECKCQTDTDAMMM